MRRPTPPSDLIFQRGCFGAFVSDMDNALRIGDIDAVRFENVPKFEQDFTLHIRHALRWISDPEAKDKIDGAIAKLNEMTNGRGGIDDPLWF